MNAPVTAEYAAEQVRLAERRRAAAKKAARDLADIASDLHIALVQHPDRRILDCLSRIHDVRLSLEETP